MPESNRAPFTHRLRVYWEDTDAGGVVFYANYLKFFERARTEWLRELGFAQHDLLQREGAMFIVVDTAVRYLQPARLDDLLDVSVELACRDGTLLAEGTIRIGCVTPGNFRPRRIPTTILERIG